MESIFIENDKLLPDMKRIRSGSTMLFYKHGNKSHQTVDADIAIKAPKHELVADLINGRWAWVNHCPECNGKKPVWSYVKCEEHDRCITCGIKRKELKEAPWGNELGFRCSPCQKEIDHRVRQESLANVAAKEYDEYDYQYQDVPKCPHCESIIHGDAHDLTEGKDTCEVCGGEYSLEKSYEVTYSTEVVGERIKQ